ncbi:SixA phosphatase family protein [Falsigemmobacter faecalis]|uniref:Histidine phosphatase family protein n=1 Tax=Falsigemmobacter faecalis TaxID=2488730 RepID=A0A3P3DI96_9RHOB|nr:histidine phosphatase family protein [Falsigemmobacter faecalis]RRH73977.1 histidine phosphatase family protein [Falsigemmobacter faecalis]
MSTLRLILTRHAKSDWGDPTAADQARPLNARGRRAAGLMADWLVSRGDLPGEVLCSDALRTRETWELMAPHFATHPPELVLKPALYHAPADVMLAVLRGAKSPVVMMIGHNPGIAEFAARLLARAPQDSDFTRYPTGATLVAGFEAETWAEVTPGSGAVIDFMTPRRLEA